MCSKKHLPYQRPEKDQLLVILQAHLCVHQLNLFPPYLTPLRMSWAQAGEVLGAERQPCGGGYDLSPKEDAEVLGWECGVGVPTPSQVRWVKAERSPCSTLRRVPAAPEGWAVRAVVREQSRALCTWPLQCWAPLSRAQPGCDVARGLWTGCWFHRVLDPPAATVVSHDRCLYSGCSSLCSDFLMAVRKCPDFWVTV